MTKHSIQQNNGPVVDARIDITADICPMTFVRTKLRMEQMAAGDVLEVTLNQGEPLENVPRSVREMGWDVLAIEEIPGQPEQRRVLIRKT
ncbi:MAG: sulfurtransferase TusA family protein [Rhodospirillales bacterium]